MWVLIISLYLAQPLGQTQSKGIIHAPQTSHEQCLQERARIQEYWHMNGYRISARCVYIKHYSQHNGAYNSDQR